MLARTLVPGKADHNRCLKRQLMVPASLPHIYAGLQLLSSLLLPQNTWLSEAPHASLYTS